ncbi:EAL domain-containing protein [Fusibacter bizertensis]|uniref:EAL domain-containing protein n=1 Tax=Fusibacter bizertensis TaxID=1488331 RepID=A0ABT6NEZ1_9FIRM|nr:EAL domain-containing protein [Fusibacter bizertensis]MDH8678997.1 EAL domain-containing protein [Fusibacter bizertensis]
MKRTLRRELFLFTTIIISIIFFTGSTAFYFFSKTVFEREEEITLKNTVEMIILTIGEKQRDVARGIKSKEQAQSELIEMLENTDVINLGEYGYPVVLDHEGLLIYHPLLKGQYALDFVDESKEKKLFVRELFEVAYSGGGFTSFLWKIPNTDKIDEKLVYVKYEPEWQWIIQATLFKSDYGLKKSSIVTQIFIVFTMVFSTTLLINHYYMRNFTKPINRLITIFETNKDGEHNFIDKTNVIEYQSLYDGFNNMMGRLSKSYKIIQDRNQDLEAANVELTALYEEMAAAEETLQANYDELQNYKQQIESEKLRYEKVIKSSYDAYWIFDVEKQLLIFENFHHFFIENKITYSEFLSRIFEEDLMEHVWIKEIGHINDEFTGEAIIRLIDNKNNLRWFKLLFIQEKDAENSLFNIYGSLKDVHEMQLEKSRIEFTAYHDDKTGLFNYDYIVLRLAEKREGLASLTMIGLRNIQHLRYVYGKNFVQIVMFQISGILRDIFGEAHDVCIFDENKILLFSDHSEMSNADFSIFIEKVNEIKFEDLLFPKDLIVTVYNKDRDNSDVQNIFRKLEHAYDFNDREYTGTYINYVDESSVAIMERNSLIEQLLLKSIKLDEISVVYQPIVDAFQSIKGFEALVRWQNSILGNITPAEFIPVAEEIDFIGKIGEFVIESVCKFLDDLNQRYNQRMRVSINASVKELIKSDYVLAVSRLITKYKIEPWQISIEITESSFSKFYDALENTITQLSTIGIETHMDDFGTGYSSLSLLGSLNVSHLKIDRSFIIDIQNDLKMAKLTEMIVEFSHKLGIKTIVEGIEDQESFEMLKNWNCDYFQGYFFSKPLNCNAVCELLNVIEN